MKSNTPITARVQAKFKNLTMPVNQEVTLKADGTGGPIIAPSGHVANAPKKSCGCSGKCGCGSPAKKALVGNQKNLPDAIKSKILAAPETPAKMSCGSPAKQTYSSIERNARQLSRANAKKEFKSSVIDAKHDSFVGNTSKKEGRKKIKEARKQYRSAKKDIRKYTDY